MKTETWLTRRAESKIGKPAFETQRLLLRLTERIAARMEERQMRRADLARDMGVDRAMVTRILNGDQNVTIKTLVAMACSLDVRLDIDLQALGAVRASATETVSTRLKFAYDGNIRARTDYSHSEEAKGDRRLHKSSTITFMVETTIGKSTITAHSAALEGECDPTAA